MRYFFLPDIVMNSIFRFCVGLLCVGGVVGCQMAPVEPATTSVPLSEVVTGYQIGAPDAWGGDVRCSAAGCLLAVVEHENGALSIYRLEKSAAKLLYTHPLAYHPDSVVWINDHLLAVAVEITQTVDVFDISKSELIPKNRVVVDFAPRNITLVQSVNGRHRLLATPYSGETVAWLDLDEQALDKVSVRKEQWCLAPWNPVLVKKFPGSAMPGIVVACRDDRKLLAIPEATVRPASPIVLAQFSPVPSMVTPSPSGEWLYVAFELGGKNLRINVNTGNQQWLPASPEGSVAVAALSEEIIIWAEDSKVKLQNITKEGDILETRWIPTSGYSTKLQLIDLNEDGEKDLVVLNSSGKYSNVIYGPLWSKARKMSSN
ncbi:MAG: hypothetical protein ACTS6O_01340 [Giesbergeria sp.]